MKRLDFEMKLRKLLKKSNAKVYDLSFMEGCTVEGDFSTWRQGYGITITIEGDEYDARDLRWMLEEWLDNSELEVSYGTQTASEDLNNDLEDESYNYSHVIVMLGRYKRFEK